MNTVKCDDMIKFEHINGSKHCAQLISMTGNVGNREMTLMIKKSLVTYPETHLRKITSIASKPLSRNSRIVNTRKRKPTSILNMSDEPKIYAARKPAKKQLYLLSLGNDYYKIGYSKNVNRRVKALKTGAIHNIQILKTQDISPDYITSYEAEKKKYFKHKFEQSEGGTEIFKIPSEKMAVQAFAK